MGQILIRNVDDAVLEGIKRRARANGTSAEAEARRALAESLDDDTQAWIARMAVLRAANGPQTGPTSLDLLREDRARDDES